MYAGIEAGGTKVLVALGTGPEDLGSVVRLPTTTPKETLGRTVETIQELARGRRLAGIGIASFGPLDLRPDSPTFGTVTSTPKPGWRGADVVGSIREAFAVPVGFDTDVNGAALGETRWGAARSLSNVVYVTVGTGIGGGGVVGGELIHGLVHPEMGHLSVRRHADDDYPGWCPFHGDCLEGLAAGPAIEGRRRSAAPGVEGKTVELEAWYLAQLVTCIVYVLSPERIILGGGVLRTPGLLTATRGQTLAQLNGYIDHPALLERIDDFVVAPGLGERSGVLGAIALAERAAHAEPVDNP